jgi:hypothetical protein
LPVGDLPFLSISSVEPNTGSATATVQWAILDVDGTSSTDAEVSINGAVVASNHSCLENTPGAFQCVTLVPLPENLNTSASFKLKLTDGELERSVIAEFVLDLTTNDGDDAEPSSASTSGLSGSMVAAVAMSVVAGLLLMLVVRRRLTVPSNEVGQTEALSVASDEVSSAGGLLARANRLK